MLSTNDRLNIIKHIKRYRIKSMNCVICLEETCITQVKNRFRSRASTDVLLKCKHCFHRKCIKSWIYSDGENTKTCPCCRSPIRFQERSYLTFMLLFKMFTAIKPYLADAYFDDEYDSVFIYHDNAGLVEFSNTRRNCIHPCSIFCKMETYLSIM